MLSLQDKVNSILKQPLLCRQLKAGIILSALAATTDSERERLSVILDNLTKNSGLNTNQKDNSSI